MRVLLLSTLAIVMFWGCPQKDKEEKGGPESSQVERTTPIAPGTPMNAAKPDRARVQLDLAKARSAVQRHKALNGEFPASLDAPNIKLSFPSDITYDPSSGTVKSQTYPAF